MFSSPAAVASDLAAVRYLTDPTLRLQVFDQWVEILYALPDFLIPYP